MTRLAAICVGIVLTLAPVQAWATSVSQITSVEGASEDAGAWNGVRYVRIRGTVRGVVAGKDIAAVRNLAVHANGYGEVTYSSRFELIVPAPGEEPNEVIYVDAENRGGAVSQGALGGFLQNHATSYGRVQWQTGYSEGVPADAQGLGLVIVRDFARFLAGRTTPTGPKAIAYPFLLMGSEPCSSPCLTGHNSYPKLILGGISQSAWFVNSFIAEGFNVDPVTGGKVFDAAIAIDGVGNWLAINQMAADLGVAQAPYVTPNGPPMDRATLLRRPASDPLYVDVANYSDFYRLRAGLTSTDASTPTFRRYDWPSPHAGSMAAHCNGGKPAVLSTVSFAPYFRALVLNIEKAIGVRSAAAAPGLPPSTVFTLGPTPEASAYFNPLAGAVVRVPVTDAERWPIGGVRFPEADNPTARPEPAAIPPADTSSISNTCGNATGWQAWDERRLTGRYGTRAGYVEAYARSLERLISQGFLLPEDREAMLRTTEKYWPAP